MPLYNIQNLPPVVWENGDMYGSPIPDECRLPSELIEQYVQRFLMMCLEELAFFKTTEQEIKARLEGVRYFVSCYGGIHSRLAVNNEIDKVTRMPEGELKRIASKIFKDANKKVDD